MDETERPGTIFSVLSSGTSVDSERLPGEMVETLSNVPGDNDDNDARSRRRRSNHQNHRRQDEVEIVSDLDCRLTTSLMTKYSQSTGETPDLGIMFSIQASSDLEILTLEFNAYSEAENLGVRVYYREGDFSGATNDPLQWTMLADTVAVLAPDSKGAIIPAVDFKAVSLQSGVKYSIYLHLQTASTLRAGRTGLQIGEVSESNGMLQTNVGVGLTEGPFPDTLANPVQFEGVIHYRTLQPCKEVLMTTDVDLLFAINSDPEQEVMDGISEEVDAAVSALLFLHPHFIEYKNQYMLEYVGTVSRVLEESVGKCPKDFDMCSVITSTLKFRHLHLIDSGTLQVEVMIDSDEIGKSVTTQSDIKVKYVGDPIVHEDFVFSFKGTSGNSAFNSAQARYFERVTTKFLNLFLEPPIYQTEVIETLVEDSYGERRLAYGLRGSRQLQVPSEVVATIYGSGVVSDLRTNVLQAMISNSDRYITDLTLQHLRPGEINAEDAGALFNDISGITVGLKPDVSISNDDGPAVEVASDDSEFGKGLNLKRGENESIWKYLILGVVGLVILCVMSIIISNICTSKRKKKKKQKAKDRQQEAKDRQQEAKDRQQEAKDSHVPPPPKRRPSRDGLKRAASTGNLVREMSKSDLRSGQSQPLRQLNRRPSWDGSIRNQTSMGNPPSMRRPSRDDLKRAASTGNLRPTKQEAKDRHVPPPPKKRPSRDDLKRAASTGNLRSTGHSNHGPAQSQSLHQRNRRPSCDGPTGNPTTTGKRPSWAGPRNPNAVSDRRLMSQSNHGTGRPQSSFRQPNRRPSQDGNRKMTDQVQMESSTRSLQSTTPRKHPPRSRSNDELQRMRQNTNPTISNRGLPKKKDGGNARFLRPSIPGLKDPPTFKSAVPSSPSDSSGRKPPSKRGVMKSRSLPMTSEKRGIKPNKSMLHIQKKLMKEKVDNSESSDESDLGDNVSDIESDNEEEMKTERMEAIQSGTKQKKQKKKKRAGNKRCHSDSDLLARMAEQSVEQVNKEKAKTEAKLIRLRKEKKEITKAKKAKKTKNAEAKGE